MSAANLQSVNTWRHCATLAPMFSPPPTEYLTSLFVNANLCDFIRRWNVEWGARQTFLAHASDWQTHWPVLSPIFTNYVPHKNRHWQEVGQRERKTKSMFLGDRYLRCLQRLQEWGVVKHLTVFTIKQTFTFALINLDGWTAIPQTKPHKQTFQISRLHVWTLLVYNKTWNVFWEPHLGSSFGEPYPALCLKLRSRFWLKCQWHVSAIWVLGLGKA